ncbi:MAG TPA: sigma 54-interacting transcriptional regulator [Thermoanaerobaculia bacterium]|nr:sigma 54-interacting transcriptional regulator [Thermoanaerobaculia bacterium]
MSAASPLALSRLLQDFPALAESLKGIERAAATEAPVLLLGEAGTGRSTVARALHHASPRAAGPLVEVDPGSIPSTLFESEFFGYRAGAFTGAETASEGRVARAAGGTLVLDHVEELPLPAQPKLLRLVAERRYSPLGGAETAADVRFVAIGSEDLPSRVTRETFRPDLFYRLEVLAFRLPALRERRADLPRLLDHLLADLGERFGVREPSLSPRARAWMIEYAWPGNLRQLRNTLERGLILAGDGPIDPPAPEGSHEARPRTLLEVEKEQIRNALAYTRGHQGRAADLLGISRKALWEKRKRYGIP